MLPPRKFLYFLGLYQNGEFYAFPEIFIDTVTALTTCFEHIFSNNGTLIKRAGVRTPWTVDTSWIRHCSNYCRHRNVQCAQSVEQSG